MTRPTAPNGRQTASDGPDGPSPPPPPSNLGPRGVALWTACLADYEITRPDELELLTEAARLADLCDDLAGQVAADGYLGVGSQGQPVAHPLLGALATARAELRNVLRQLRLPDADGLDDVERGARHAARARWR